MFFAGKIGCSGIVFMLLTTWISGPRPTPTDASSNLTGRVPANTHWDDTKKIQQNLQDRGHYHGKIDGVPGLRTRASIRGFQKAENLPITGQLDAQTADKLEVRPEVREETRHETSQEKPSAGVQWAKGSRQRRKTPRQPIRKSAFPQSSQKDGEKSLQAQNDKHQ